MKKIVLFFIAILTFSSCSDFLEETNRNSITGDILYSTPEGYESLVNACYSYTRAWFGKPDGYALLKWERIAIQVVAPIVDVHHSWLSIHRIYKVVKP